MRAGRTYYNLIAVIVLIAVTFLALISGVGYSYAATTRYTDVLDDLRKDSTFKFANYPALNSDYRLDLIQVAESTDGELFVYVYQPAAKTRLLKATNINMSLSEEATGTELYDLDLLNSTGVFAKYRVKGLTVRSNKSIRYYNISSIYRDYVNDVDDENKSENILDKVAFQVGKVFTATTMNGDVIYFQEPTYTVKIINPVTDYLTHISSYSTGELWWLDGGKWNIFDSHFIAFSTDWDIDRLVSADVSYHYCSGSSYYDQLFGFELNADVSYGEDKETTVTLNADDKFEHTNSIHGFTYSTYSWDKIITTDDFIAAVRSASGLSHNNAYNNLESILDGSEWVLNFCETERTQSDTNVAGVYKKYTSNFTKISNVTVLRLEFESDGKAYNLGAVSNTVSKEYPAAGSWHWYDDIVNFFNRVGNFFANLFNQLKNLGWWQWILLILAIVLVIGLVVGIAKFGIAAVAKFVGWLLTKIGQALWWLISAPFRGIAALIRKRQEAAPAKVAPSKSRKTKAPKAKSAKPRTSRPRTQNTGKAKPRTSRRRTRKTGKGKR